MAEPATSAVLYTRGRGLAETCMSTSYCSQRYHVVCRAEGIYWFFGEQAVCCRFAFFSNWYRGRAASREVLTSESPLLSRLPDYADLSGALRPMGLRAH